MKKLELKHIQHYDLETLRFITTTSNNKRQIASINPIMGYVQDTENESWSFEHIKSIVRPMSDLNKPLEDGSIPIVELAKIAIAPFLDVDYNFEVNPLPDDPNCFKLVIKKNNISIIEMFFEETEVNGFIAMETSTELVLPIANQLQLFEYLFEHHFDVYGLIEEGLAIDINTIQEYLK